MMSLLGKESTHCAMICLFLFACGKTVDMTGCDMSTRQTTTRDLLYLQGIRYQCKDWVWPLGNCLPGCIGRGLAFCSLVYQSCRKDGNEIWVPSLKSGQSQRYELRLNVFMLEAVLPHTKKILKLFQFMFRMI